MARPSNTEQRQEQIVDGLLEVMAERGYERASVAAVAKAAGLTPGVVHYHFVSKQEILLRLVETLGKRLQAKLRVTLERSEGPQRRLAAFVDLHLARGAGADAQAVACWVAISAEAIRQPPVAAALRKVLATDLELLTDLVRACLRHNGQPARQASSLSAGILSTIQGYLLLAASAPELVPHGSAAPTVKRLLAGVLGKR